MIDTYWTKEDFMLRCIHSMDIALRNTKVINDNAKAINRYLKIAEVLSKLYKGNRNDFDPQKVAWIIAKLNKYWVKLLPPKKPVVERKIKDISNPKLIGATHKKRPLKRNRK